MQITPYDFSGKTVRILTDDKCEPWWVATDVCGSLGIANPTQAVAALDQDERSMINIGRQGYANIISEAGLYSLIIRSNKKRAKKFKRWITHDILPTIRKTGSYSVSYPIQKQLPQDYEEALEALLGSVRENKKLETENKKLIPQAETLKQISISNGLVSFTKAAKILSVKPKQFIDRLLILKILYRDKTSARTLLPMQYYVDHGWFEVKTVGIDDKYTQTLVTQMGLTKLGNRFNKI